MRGSASEFYAIAGRATGQGQSSDASKRWAAMGKGIHHVITLQDSGTPVNRAAAIDSPRVILVALPVGLTLSKGNFK